MIGIRLLAVLNEKKISQADLSRSLQVHPTRVNEWIKNKVKPTYETIVKIAKVLDVSVSELVGESPDPEPGWIKIPVLGEVPAGNPVEANELIINYFSIPAEMKKQMDFGLIVKGCSMIGAGILDKDVVFVKCQPVAENRQIVVARLNGDTTVKRFFRTNHSVILRPENPDFDPILIGPDYPGEFAISGIVTGLWRQWF